MIGRRLALSSPGLALLAIWKRWRRSRRLRSQDSRPGRCPLCAAPTRFVALSDQVRESPVCVRCGSVPRQRAVAKVLHELGLDLPRSVVHESSPSLCSWHFLRRVAARAVGSYYFEGTTAKRVGVFHAVDLRAQPFANAEFDIVVTQDVFEHVPEPLRAFAEIHRTLRAGGAHVFTLPRQLHADTRARARLVDGRSELLLPAQHHRNPIEQGGSLVVTDWGRDLEAMLARELDITCTATWVHAPELGIDAPIEVFVGRAG